MKIKTLTIYFLILVILCAGFVAGARMMGQQGMYLASGYMLTPAIAAIITRLFFYKPRFRDAGLHLGRLSGYIKFWLYSLAITALSYAMFALLGPIRWDFSGKILLNLLDQQSAMTGQDVTASLPPGFTPQMMLWLFVLGDLTVFNILPGLITGFGEEFGHRGLMFPLLQRNRLWIGLLIGGFIWYLWHQPLALIFPAAAPQPLWQILTTHLVAVIGSICAHTYFCYIYAKSGSILVPSVAHIAMNNAASALSYFVILQDQFTANIAQYLVMVLVVAFLYFRKELHILLEPSPPERERPREQELLAAGGHP